MKPNPPQGDISVSKAAIQQRVEESMMDFKADFSTWDPEDRRLFLAELRAVDKAFRERDLQLHIESPLPPSCGNVLRFPDRPDRTCHRQRGHEGQHQTVIWWD